MLINRKIEEELDEEVMSSFIASKSILMNAGKISAKFNGKITLLTK